jgi:hypothetical protein
LDDFVPIKYIMPGKPDFLIRCIQLGDSVFFVCHVFILSKML